METIDKNRQFKVGDKIVVTSLIDTGITYSENIKPGVVRNIYRIDKGNYLSIVIKVNNRLYGLNEKNISHFTS